MAPDPFRCIFKSPGGASSREGEHLTLALPLSCSRKSPASSAEISIASDIDLISRRALRERKETLALTCCFAGSRSLAPLCGSGDIREHVPPLSDEVKQRNKSPARVKHASADWRASRMARVATRNRKAFSPYAAPNGDLQVLGGHLRQLHVYGSTFSDAT